MKSKDSNGKGLLPVGITDATALSIAIEEEVRISRSEGIPDEEMRFSEERPIILADTERDRFLALIEQPPQPGEDLRNAISA